MQSGIMVHENYARQREKERTADGQVYQHMHCWSWDVPILMFDDLACGLGRFEIWGQEVKQIADALPSVPIRGRYGVL